MILQIGAVVIEHVVIKSGLWAIENTIGLGWWGISSIYQYYYSNTDDNTTTLNIEDANNDANNDTNNDANNDTNNDANELKYLKQELQNQKKEINVLKHELEHCRYN